MFDGKRREKMICWRFGKGRGTTSGGTGRDGKWSSVNGSGIGREHFRDGMGLHGFLVRQDETGNDRGTSGIGRELGQDYSREYGRETLSGMVRNTIGNAGWRHD